MNDEWETIAVGPSVSDEWETIAVGPALDPQSFGSKAYDALARGGSGLFSFASMLGESLSGQGVANQLGSLFSGQPKELASQELARITQERVPKPTSPDALERYSLGGIEAAPMALLGPMSLTNLLSSVGAGVGGEVAKDLGAPEWAGQLFGGLTPQAATSLTKATIRPFYSSGQRALAGQSLLANAGQEGAERLLQNADDVASYAEIANTPSAAAYQQAMRKIPGEGANAMEAALSIKPKEEAVSLLQALAPDAFTGTPQVLKGQVLQQGVLAAADDAWEQAGNIYKALPNADNTVIPLGTVNKNVSEKFASLFGKSKLAPDSDLIRVMEGVSEAPTKTLAEISQLQGDVGATIGKIARSNPKAKELPVLYKIKEELTSAIDDALTSGTGLSKTQVDAFKAAKANYAETGQKFGTPLVKAMTKRGPFGSLEAGAPASTMIPKIIAKPESAKQFMRAMGDNVDMVQQARAGLLDSMPKDFESWGNFFSKKKDVFKELFGKDFPEVEKIMLSIERRNSAAALASKASRSQSGTAQFTTAMQKLVTNGPRALMRALGTGTGTGAAGVAGYSIGNIPGAIAGAALARVVRWAENNIETLIQRAMVEPELRKALLAEGTRANQRKLMQKLVPIAAIMMRGEIADKVKNER